MSDDIIEEETPEFPPTPCAFCGEDGLNLKGWDEEGEEINETCSECGGTGIFG